MAWYTVWIVGSLAVALAALGAAWLAARHVAYRRQLRYDPRTDYAYDLSHACRRPIPVEWAGDGLTVPALTDGVGAALLKVRVSATAAGRFVDPYLEVEAGDEVVRQYFERGANGVRVLNVSRLFRGGWAGGRVRIRRRHCRWKGDEPTLYLFDDAIRPGERVVVIAPHPDDAEIAAFGVYSNTDAVVVTLTAGDGSDRLNHLHPLPEGTVARLRVWDSITVPRLGGVPPTRAVNLGYPDGRLAELAAEPTCVCRKHKEFQELRGMNLSPLVRDGGMCSWESLVEDLAHVFRHVRPTSIVTPSPVHDAHSDHCFATAAVAEAAGLAGLTNCRLLLYVVHDLRTELYPYGVASAGVGLPPSLDASVDSEFEILSYPLSAQQQKMKYLALEMMHDVRSIGPVGVTIRQWLRTALAGLKGLLHGMGNPPTCLLRRGARPDEVFLVLPLQRASACIARWRASHASRLGTR